MKNNATLDRVSPMKPATPLPWHDVYLNWVQPLKDEPNTPQKNLPVDNRFALHACNAYPRLVAELKRLCVEIPAQLGAPPMKNALLRELGEQ